MGRQIEKLLIHCADTREDDPTTVKNEDMDIGAVEIEQWHRERAAKEPWSPYTIEPGKYGFIGYHYVIRRNGAIEAGRPEHIAGCHARGHNSTSLAVCWVGRIRITKPQKESLLRICSDIMRRFGLDIKQVFGHCEFSSKTCPNLEMDLFRSELEFFHANQKEC